MALFFPRASELKAFDGVDARAAALSNLTVCYHRESGFLGHKIKAEMGERGTGMCSLRI